MTYEIHITRHAQLDLEAALDYIEYKLFNPDEAESLQNELEKAAHELESFPERYPLAPDSVLRNWNIRFIAVKNYYLFYTVRESNVYLVRFLHKRRNWIRLLRDEINSSEQ